MLGTQKQKKKDEEGQGQMKQQAEDCYNRLEEDCVIRGLSIEYEMRSSQSSASSCSLANSMALSTSSNSSMIICRALLQFPILPGGGGITWIILLQKHLQAVRRPSLTLTEQEDGLLHKVPLLTHLQSLRQEGETT